MKIDLNRNVTGLDGVEIPDSNIGKMVANVLAQSTQGDSLKLMSWATKLYNGEELDLDPSDTIVFNEFIKNSQNFTNLLKSRVLESLV